eukprot:9475796-Pyramimonas_sp.AAC.1
MLQTTPIDQELFFNKIYSCRQHVNMSAVDVCSEIENNDVNQSPRYFVHIILATVPLAHTSDLKARN